MSANPIKNNLSPKDIGNYTKIRKITWIGLIVNILLSVIKFIFGLLGRSQAIIADAVHSLSDMSTDFAILFGVRFWSKPADEDHPYGHKRIETIVTAAISFLLLTVALGIGFSALVAIRDKHIQQPGLIALVGALISIVSKEILYHKTLAVGKEVKSSAVVANAWHHRTDAFSSIPVALTVAAAAINPQWSFLDRIGALVVSLVILHVAFKMVRSVLLELIDSGASRNIREKIEAIVLTINAVKSTHAIRTRRMGSDLYVDLHIMVDGQMTVQKGHEISKEVKRELLKKGPGVVDVIVHLEPHEKGV